MPRYRYRTPARTYTQQAQEPVMPTLIDPATGRHLSEEEVEAATRSVKTSMSNAHKPADFIKGPVMPDATADYLPKTGIMTAIGPKPDLVGQFLLISQLGLDDARHLQEKDASYGSSWRKRGGIGAFMMLSRKWDRLETMLEREYNYDVFAAINDHNAKVAAGTMDKENHVLEQIRDLRRYLFLVDSWMLAQPPVQDDRNPYLARKHPTLAEVTKVDVTQEGLYGKMESGLPHSH